MDSTSFSAIIRNHAKSKARFGAAGWSDRFAIGAGHFMNVYKRDTA